MGQVFISYAAEWREQVDRLAAWLDTLKVDYWHDVSLRSGANYVAEISKNINSASAVIVCWSTEAANSEWVLAEAETSRQMQIFCPVFLEQCAVPPPFNVIHGEKLYPWSNTSQPPRLHSLMERIGHLIGRPSLADWSRAIASHDASKILHLAEIYPQDPLATQAQALAMIAIKNDGGLVNPWVKPKITLFQRFRIYLTRTIAPALFGVAILTSFGVGAAFLHAKWNESKEVSYSKWRSEIGREVTPTELRIFIAANPEAKEIEEARSKLENLELAAWQKALQINTRSSYEEYLKLFPVNAEPKSNFTKQALEHIDSSQRRK